MAKRFIGCSFINLFLSGMTVRLHHHSQLRHSQMNFRLPPLRAILGIESSCETRIKRTLLMGSIFLISVASNAGQAQQLKGTESRVPFVGCRSDGQVGPQPAPKSRRTPLIPSNEARRLAYYAASTGPGVLAPRGWHCFGAYGSGGDSLVVTPETLGSELRTGGGAVELTYAFGGTSGRGTVADAIARYFPRYRDFIRANLEFLKDRGFPSGPYAHDSFSRRTDTLVRYVTPARTRGGGTESALAPSTEPIQGLAMLVIDTDGPDLLQVRVRLPDSDHGLAGTILHEAELEGRH